MKNLIFGKKKKICHNRPALLEPYKNIWWDLKKAIAKCKLMIISELVVTAHKEWVRINQKGCQKYFSCYSSHVQFY